MTTVFKEMGIRRKVSGDIGIEIEVEGYNLPVAGAFWRNEEDGSLKAAETREYVLSEPSSLAGAKKALNYLDKLYRVNETVVDDSVRAGVHVHINCQQLTLTELYNYITTFLVLENVLVRWCGKYREGNLFCLRSSDAEHMLDTIRLAARDNRRRFQLRFHTDEMRYAAMNLKALGDYGSVEFRTMRGTRDLDQIYLWAETLLHLREFSRQFENPMQIIEQLSFHGMEEFVRQALGKNAEVFLTQGWEQLAHDGMRNAQYIAYCRDWSTFDPEKKIVGGLEFDIDSEANEPEEDV